MDYRAIEPLRRCIFGSLFSVFVAVALTGCIHQPEYLPLSRQRVLDGSLVEYPTGCRLSQVVKDLNCPTAMCWNSDGDMLIAESGIDGGEPHIFGYHHKDHTYFNIYPYHRTISFFPTSGFVMYGPVGGMVCYQDRIYVSHRDRQGRGVITQLGYKGTHSTIIAGLPAQGDYGVTDVIIHNDRLYFGVGTATNSGVVGIDNYDEGWLKLHPRVHDEMYSPDSLTLKTQGARFDTPDPRAGLFSPAISITVPFQPFGQSTETRIRSTDKPNGSVCSIGLNDGTLKLKIEAFGLHNPRGLAFDADDRFFVTNDGMELRGTRPIADDPDSLIRITSDSTWLGWPDFTTDGHSVSEPTYRPPLSMLIATGYGEISSLIDPTASKLRLPVDFNNVVFGVFPSLSGAAKMAFVPENGPFKESAGKALVALDGDRTPFASSGVKLINRQGFEVALVDLDRKTVDPFIRNTARVPASMQPFGTFALERPCDVKVGPDGAIYILDFGRMDNNSAIPRYYPGTGGLFRLEKVGPGSAESGVKE
jgi:glucose/arabinose dehydrogenase